MGGSSKKQIVGYKYSVGMHQIYCHGPVDLISKIRVGDTADVWTGSATASTQLSVNAPNAFGGESKEGGVVGTVDVAMGDTAQGVNAYLAGKLTGFPVPAFRGLCALILEQVYVAALNPYIKPWAIFAKRIPKVWYSAKAELPSGDANPAHILYDVLTNTVYGMGYPDSYLDLTSFQTAADTLYSEGLGLSILWEGQQTIDEFVTLILEHIDASMYVNVKTGLFTLKLARNDYTPGSLPIFSTSNILRVERFSTPLPGELSNEVIMQYHERDLGQDASVSVQDIALIQLQGGQKVTVTRTYRGIPNATLAATIAARELRTLSAPLARAVIICNRQAWNQNLGDVFRFQWPAYGVADMVMRVAAIDYGELASGEIRIEAVQDVFSTATTLFSPPAATGWSTTSTLPAPCPKRVLFEVPYWTLDREIVGSFSGMFTNIDPAAGLVGASGARPSSDSYSFDMEDMAGSTAYSVKDSGGFCPTADVSGAQVATYTDTLLNVVNLVDFSGVALNTWAIWDNEIVKVKGVSANTVTVARGILDTVPQAHANLSTIYFVDQNKAIDQTQWLSGDVVSVKLLPRTSQGVLAEASAPVDNITLAGRYIRPYPPGNLQINGTAYPSTIAAASDLTLTWVHRDRTQQTVTLVEQTAASISLEAGATYTLNIYNALTGGTLIHSYTGLTGASQVYTVAQATTDNGGTRPTAIRIELWTVRSGYVSWQKQIQAFTWI